MKELSSDSTSRHFFLYFKMKLLSIRLPSLEEQHKGGTRHRVSPDPSGSQVLPRRELARRTYTMVELSAGDLYTQVQGVRLWRRCSRGAWSKDNLQILCMFRRYRWVLVVVREHSFENTNPTFDKWVVDLVCGPITF